MNFRDRLKLKGIEVEGASSERKVEYLIEIYHEFMKFYKCWIPFKEFSEMSISLTLSLLDKINRDRELVIPQPVVIYGMAKKTEVDRVASHNRTILSKLKMGGLNG